MSQLSVVVKHPEGFLAAQLRWMIPGCGESLPTEIDITTLTAMEPHLLRTYLVLYAYAQNETLLQPTSASLWRAVLGVRSQTFHEHLDELQAQNLLRRTYVSGRHVLWLYPPKFAGEMPEVLPLHTRVANLQAMPKDEPPVAGGQERPRRTPAVQAMPMPLTSIAVKISADGVSFREKPVKAPIAAAPGDYAPGNAIERDAQKVLRLRRGQVRAAACPQALTTSGKSLEVSQQEEPSEASSDPVGGPGVAPGLPTQSFLFKKGKGFTPYSRSRSKFSIKNLLGRQPGALPASGGQLPENFPLREKFRSASAGVWVVEKRFRGTSVLEIPDSDAQIYVRMEEFMDAALEKSRLDGLNPGTRVLLRASSHTPRKRVHYPDDVEAKARVAWDHFLARWHDVYKTGFNGQWHVHRRVFARQVTENDAAWLAAVIDVFFAKVSRDNPDYPAMRKYGHTPQVMAHVIPALLDQYLGIIHQRADEYRRGVGPLSPAMTALRVPLTSSTQAAS